MSGVPYMFVDNPYVTEGTAPGAPTMMNFTVSLTSPATNYVSVDYRTADRTATAGSDYIPVANTLTIAPGQTSGTIQVPIVADSQMEPTELVDLNLSNARNADLFISLGIGSILDDDIPVDPTLSISDPYMMRGLNGSKTMIFTVDLNTTLSYPIAVNASTMDFTARAGVDYAATNQTLIFNPGERSKQVAVTVYGSSAVVPDAFFLMNLSGSSVPMSKPYGFGILQYGA